MNPRPENQAQREHETALVQPLDQGAGPKNIRAELHPGVSYSFLWFSYSFLLFSYGFLIVFFCFLIVFFCFLQFKTIRKPEENKRKPEENPKKTRENQRKPKEKKTAAPPAFIRGSRGSNGRRGGISRSF